MRLYLFKIKEEPKMDLKEINEKLKLKRNMIDEAKKNILVLRDDVRNLVAQKKKLRAEKLLASSKRLAQNAEKLLTPA